MKLFLHIHHFDSGEEEDTVLSLLAADRITERFRVVGRAEEGNSVLVEIGDFEQRDIQTKIVQVLSLLSQETLHRLAEMDIDISLRLHVEGMSAYFEPRVLTLAGEKGVQIYIFNLG